MIAFVTSNILNILLVLVGLSAFGVYFWQKHDQVRVAATLVKGEIDSIEKSIAVLKNDNQLGNISVYHSKTIIGENLWSKYKHLLIKYLSKSEYETIECFFDNAERIEHARVDIVNSMNNAWAHASFVEHYTAGLFAQNSTDQQQLLIQIEDFRQKYRPLDIVFTPQVAINALVKHLGNFNVLSGTTGYRKIERLSYDK